MPAPLDLHLNVPVDQARHLVGTGLTEQGFTVEPTERGLRVTRGSMGLTMLGGAWAGDSMHVGFDAIVTPEAGGSLVAVEQSDAAKFFKGGVIGASKASDVVQEAMHRLGTSLQARGLLSGQVPAAALPAGTAAPAGAGPSDAPDGTVPPAGAVPPAGSGSPDGAVPPPVGYAGRTNIVAIFALIFAFLIPLGGIVAGVIALGQVKRTGEKGRGLAIAGIAVGSVLTVLIVVSAIVATVAFATLAGRTGSTAGSDPLPYPSSEVPAPDDAPVEVPLVAQGECLVDDAGGLLSVDCATPHDYEVYALDTVAGDLFPGDEAITAQSEETCEAAFEGFVGIPALESSLVYSYVTPVAETWEGGDRQIACVVYDPVEPTTGSLAGSAR